MDILDEYTFHCFTAVVFTPYGHNFFKLYFTVQSCIACTKRYFTKDLSFRTASLSERWLITLKKQMHSVWQSVKPMRPELVKWFLMLAQVWSWRPWSAAYFKTYLELHKTTAAVSRRKLIKPIRNLEDTMCENHEKVLELFCKKETDHSHENNHRWHRITTAESDSSLFYINFMMFFLL